MIKIGIIGVGHIGQAVLKGLLQKISPENFILANPRTDKLNELKSKYNIKITSDNIVAVMQSQIIILAVKPKKIKEVIEEIKPYLSEDKILISVAACITLEILEQYLGKKSYKVIRLMPNIPVNNNKGVIGWLINSKINKKEKDAIEKLVSFLGLSIKCKNDEEIDKLCMISGCGPGYVAFFMEALKEVAKEYGFNDEVAEKIVLATFSGTAHYLNDTPMKFRQLINAVTTKGGVTEEVIKHFKKKRYFENIRSSINAGYLRSKKISINLSDYTKRGDL